jgi:hypothetical protein
MKLKNCLGDELADILPAIITALFFIVGILTAIIINL